MTSAIVDSTNYETIVPETAGPGRLTAIGIAGGREYHYVKITLDDNEVLDEIVCGSNTRAADSNMGLGVDLPFDAKIKVEGKDSKRSSITRFLVAYVTENSPIAGTPSLETSYSEATKRAYLRRVSMFVGERGSYVTNELVGPRFRSYIELESDVVHPGTPIRGAVRVLDELSGDQIKVGDLPLSVTLRDYDEPLAGGQTSDGQFEISIDDRYIRVPLEIATTSEEFANIPARFVIL
jgi:hypothetical protein